MMVLKAGSISTLDIIAGIKQKVIDFKDSLPDNLKVGFVGDQSLFVRGAISGVIREGIIAALLTSVMILLFLGSWRSTIIIATSIPLAVFGSIIMLAALGETLNIMTLGGLALAVGILVDEATVTIENINGTWSRARKSSPRFSMAPIRSWCRPSCRCCVSASCSFRCSSCRASPASCSYRWPKR